MGTAKFSRFAVSSLCLLVSGRGAANARSQRAKSASTVLLVVCRSIIGKFTNRPLWHSLLLIPLPRRVDGEAGRGGLPLSWRVRRRRHRYPPTCRWFARRGFLGSDQAGGLGFRGRRGVQTFRFPAREGRFEEETSRAEQIRDPRRGGEKGGAAGRPGFNGFSGRGFELVAGHGFRAQIRDSRS